MLQFRASGRAAAAVAEAVTVAVAAGVAGVAEAAVVAVRWRILLCVLGYLPLLLKPERTQTILKKRDVMAGSDQVDRPSRSAKSYQPSLSAKSCLLCASPLRISGAYPDNGVGFSDSLKNASARTGYHSCGRTTRHAPQSEKMIGETCVPKTVKVDRKTSSRGKAGTKTASPRKAGKDSSKNASKDALQFAPNFTAYVMPLMSCALFGGPEFFLHGELYCALANAIAKGGKSAKDLLRDLQPQFPSDKIEEAVRRLTERRYVTTATYDSTGAVAGYWASLGCRRKWPRKSRQLQGARRIIRCGRRQGTHRRFGRARRSRGAAFAGSHHHAGERLSRTASGGIESATCRGQDTLAAGTALRRLSVGRAGIQAGESACWTCLFDRMIRNREVKGFLDRGQARPVAISPLARNRWARRDPVAAVEIAKAIASGFRTDLSNTSQAST